VSKQRFVIATQKSGFSSVKDKRQEPNETNPFYVDFLLLLNLFLTIAIAFPFLLHVAMTQREVGDLIFAFVFPSSFLRKGHTFTLLPWKKENIFFLFIPAMSIKKESSQQ
jgi:hypothetical protein